MILENSQETKRELSTAIELKSAVPASPALTEI
jgi:hypothetical protein